MLIYINYADSGSCVKSSACAPEPKHQDSIWRVTVLRYSTVA